MIDFAGWAPVDLKNFIANNGRGIDERTFCPCDTCKAVINTEIPTEEKVRLAKEELLARWIRSIT